MSKGVELAVGYISIVPDTSQVGPGIEKALAASAGSAARFSATMGNELGRGISTGVAQASAAFTQLSGAGGNAGRNAGQEFARHVLPAVSTAGKASSVGFFQEFRTTSERVGAITGLAIGKTIGLGISVGIKALDAVSIVNAVGAKVFLPMERAASVAGHKIGGMLATSLKGALFAAGATAGIAGVGGLASVITGGIDRLSTMQTSGVQLSLKLNPEEIKNIQKEVTKAVEGTPVPLDLAMSSVTQYVNRGNKDPAQAKQYVKDIADLTGATGDINQYSNVADIMGRIGLNGTVDGNILDRLESANVDLASMMKDAFGWTKEQYMAQKNTITQDQFRQAIQKTHGAVDNGEGVPTGLAQKLGQTYTGAVGNFGAARKRFGASIIASIVGKTPDEDPLKDYAIGIDKVSKAFDGMSSWVKAHREEIHSFFVAGKNVVGGMFTALGPLMKLLAAHPGLVAGALGAWGTWKGLSAATGPLQGAVGKLGELAMKLDHIPTAAGKAKTAMGELNVAEAGAAAGASGAGAVAGGAAAGAAASKGGKLAKAGKGVARLGGKVMGAIPYVGAAMFIYDMLDEIPAVREFTDQIPVWFGKAKDAITKSFESGSIRNFINQAKPQLISFVDAFKNAWDKIPNSIRTLRTKIGELVSDIKTKLSDAIANVFGKDTFLGKVFNGIGNVVDTVKGFINDHSGGGNSNNSIAPGMPQAQADAGVPFNAGPMAPGAKPPTVPPAAAPAAPAGPPLGGNAPAPSGLFGSGAGVNQGLPPSAGGLSLSDAGSAYGLPLGTNTGGYGNPSAANIFPQWVLDLGKKYGMSPSTYADHQEYGGANHGIDWIAEGYAGRTNDPVAVARQQAFAEALASTKIPGLEQVIWNNPETGQKVGIGPGDKPVGPGTDQPGYYRDDWAGHQDHVHTSFSRNLNVAGGGPADGGLFGKSAYFGGAAGVKTDKAEVDVKGQAIFNIGGGAKGLNQPPAAAPAGAGEIPLTQRPDGTWTSSNPAWAHLINRESGGIADRVQEIKDVNSGGNEAEGLFQITPETWKSLGGDQFAKSPKLATPQQQAAMAAKLLRRNPNGSDWGANLGLPDRESAPELLAALGPAPAAPAPAKPAAPAPAKPAPAPQPGAKDLKSMLLPPGFASGGSVWGAGTATSDSIPAMLSAGEHVLTADDVAKMGGQDAVYAFRDGLHRDDGGGVDWSYISKDDQKSLWENMKQTYTNMMYGPDKLGDAQVVNSVVPYMTGLGSSQKIDTGPLGPTLSGGGNDVIDFNAGPHKARGGAIQRFAPGGPVIPQPPDPKLAADLAHQQEVLKAQVAIAEKQKNEIEADSTATDRQKADAYNNYAKINGELSRLSTNAPILLAGGQPADTSIQDNLNSTAETLRNAILDQREQAKSTTPVPESDKMKADLSVSSAQYDFNNAQEAAKKASAGEPEKTPSLLDNLMRTPGFTPTGGGGKAGTSSLAKVIGFGGDIVSGIIDTGASLAQTAVSAAIGVGTMGAGAAAGPAAGAAAGYGINLAAAEAKGIVNYWWDLAGIGADALVQQLFPIGGPPRILGYDYTKFAPQLDIMGAATTTMEQMGSAAIKSYFDPNRGKQFNTPTVPPTETSGSASATLPGPAQSPISVGGPAAPGSPTGAPVNGMSPGAAGMIAPTLPGPALTQPSLPPAPPNSNPNSPVPFDMNWYQNQVTGNGMYAGGAVNLYDNGGWLEPGQLGVNLTSKPEPVLTPQQWDAISQNAPETGSSGPMVKIDAIYGLSPEDVASQIESKQRLAAMQYSGRPYK